MLDSSLLSDYIATFNGYGDYRAPYWLVGMEEGGGGSLDALNRRLVSWERQGKGELSDLSPHHEDGDAVNERGKQGKLQSTWSQLIRVVLAIGRQPTDNATVLEYQRTQLGRSGGETCLLELMPLPSPGLSRWLYSQYSSLPGLESRAAYMKHYAPARIERLRARMVEHKPAFVMFYSLGYVQYWRQVASVPLTTTSIGGVTTYFGRNEHTVFAVVPQPAARIRGKGSGYYVEVGRVVAGMIVLGLGQSTLQANYIIGPLGAVMCLRSR